VVLGAPHGACAAKVMVSGEDELTLRLRPWICVLETSVTPAAGVSDERTQPDGAVRLNDPIWPLVDVIVNDVDWVVPAGTLDGEIVPTAVPAADAHGASKAVPARSTRTRGTRSMRLRDRLNTSSLLG
jgi:hypothetical protein